MDNKKFFKINIVGCERNLPICSINEEISIAAFIMFGDVEVTQKSAHELLKICPPFDILITAESKGIPLCYEMSRQCGKNYMVARKSEKIYMKNPISARVKSITTKGDQTLYLPESEFKSLENKNILIVDDVISTGNSLLALEKIVTQAKGKIVGKACVIAEGDAIKRNDIIFLNTLPLFKN